MKAFWLLFLDTVHAHGVFRSFGFLHDLNGDVFLGRFLRLRLDYE